MRQAGSLTNARKVLLGASLFLVGAFSGCTCDETAKPCDAELSGQCGASCMTDSNCPTGLYCGSEGKCTADCTAMTKCANDAACDANGRCGNTSSFASGTGGGNTFSTGSGTMSTGSACGEVNISFAPQIPTVMLVIDQSGSMNADFNGKTRWDALRDALMDPTTGVVKTLDAKVRFALTLYSGENGTCPDLTQVIPPGLGNYAAIEAVYGPSTWKNNTPTGESISAVTPALVSFAEPGPKVIILGTDGDPDTCADPNSNGTQPPKDVSLAAVKAAFDQGVETFIIAVGDQVSGPHQQDMANAGVGLAFPAPNPCDQVNDPTHCATSFNPSSQQGLVDAFNQIISGQKTCIFTLDGMVVAGKECEGVVTVDGMTIPCNDPNGWKLNSASEIEFLGTTCAEILADPNAMISAKFPCDAASGPPS